MDILWNKYVEVLGLWKPDCFGLFIKRNNRVTFFFKDRSNLLSISEEDSKPQLLYSCGSNENLPLPRCWAIVEKPNVAFVLFSSDQGFDLKYNEFSYDIPAQIQKEYNQEVPTAEYLVNAPQELGEFTIYHKGNCGYICKRENSKMWEFTGRAYLYTKMVRWKNRLYFGTGGNGGFFYVLDIHSGIPVASIKTGGTQCVVQVDNLCYVLKNEKTAQLLCLDLSNGKIVSQCELPGIATIDSRVARIDNRIHVITFVPSHSKNDSFIWSCVNM